jgi:RimJ/RimL family protein N-acetyltransferase
MYRFILIGLMSFSGFCCSSDNNPRYFIREAHWGDKNAMIDLYKKSQNYYKERLLDTRLATRQIVEFDLIPLIDEGFAFVVELLFDDGNCKIIGFLIKRRPCAKSYRHLLDHGFSAIDPDYRKEMLLTQLYQHLQAHIKEYYPDILRIEAICHDHAYENIAMFERCNFVLEGICERAVHLSDGSFADELRFVWWNDNFYKK